MKLLLDTHALLWWCTDDARLSTAAAVISKAKRRLPDLPEGVYSLSCPAKSHRASIFVNGWATPGAVLVWDLASGEAHTVWSVNLAGPRFASCTSQGDLHIYASVNMLRCMRTTFDISDPLLAEAKSLAAQRGLSLKALVEEALRERLRARGDGRRVVEQLPTYSGHGLQAGVDLTDSAALLELMDADAGR